MRRAALAIVSTVAGLVLLVGFKPDTDPTLTSAGSSTSSTPAGPSAGVGAAATPAEEPGGTSGTFVGDVVQTRWGPVQVRATLTDGRLSAVDVLQVPDENRRDREINERAVPVLVAESLDAGSADVDMVSGATVTSQGYVGSLQSALDTARG